MMKTLLAALILFAFLPVRGQNTFPSSGNVGIGTSSPANLLYVYNSTAPSNTVGSTSEVSNFVGTTGNLLQMKFLYRRHTLNGDWTSISSRLQAVTDVTNQGYLEFNPQGEPYGLAIGTGSTELMRFKLNGNVGIGTTDPLVKLTVAASGQADGIWIDGTGTTNIALLNNTGAGNWNQLSQPGDNLILWKGSAVDGSDAGGLVLGPWSNSSTGMRITYNGNVGIGTSAPGPYKLAVEGTIGARKIKVTQANPWADYVFDNNYRLPDLGEVEKYILLHKHLPEVPSVEEVKKDGIDIGENQALLLRKIEELTLYVIQQNKEIKLLKERDKKIDALQLKVDKLTKLLQKQ